MADQILHNTNTVVDSSGFVANVALRDSGVTANSYITTKTGAVGITVDVKGRVTNAFVNTSIKTSSIEIAAANSSANTEAFAHVTDQRIYISTSAPADNSIGNNGDIWYQTLT